MIIIPKKPVLLLKVYMIVIFFWILTRFLSPKQILPFLQTEVSRFFHYSQDQYSQLLAYLNFALCHWPLRRCKSYCLIYCMVLFCVLKPFYKDLKIVFGVRRTNQKIYGHSWLESEEQPLFDSPTVPTQFKKLGTYA